MSTTRADRAKLGRCDLLLTGGVVVTVDDDFTVFDAGAVAIVDDRIVGVGHKSEFASVDATRTVDCSGKLCTVRYAALVELLSYSSCIFID